MKILHNIDSLTITIQACSTICFNDILETLKDVKKEYAGETSNRQKQKQLMNDMEQQIAELLSEEELE